MTSELVPAVVPDALVEFSTQGGISRAMEIANQLDEIIRRPTRLYPKGLAVKIGDGEHLRVEAWLALGSMVGITPRTREVVEVRNEEGALEGYTAYVEAVRIATGEVIGGAQAGCFYDEMMRGQPRWKDRHAVLSMCQTRATSKALGQILRFIPVLAGYSGTPAEEMPVAESTPRVPREKPVTAKTLASDEQIRALKAASYDRCAELGLGRDHKAAASIRKAALAHFGLESTRIPAIAVEALERAILDATLVDGHGHIPKTPEAEAFE